MSHKDDYDLSEKIKIKFKGMDYYVMPRYTHHYLENDYEKFSLQILKNDLHADSVFVDIGAHYGAYSLCAAQASGSKVLAIEPVAENFELLNLNVTTNKLQGLISTYNYAASDENGEADFNIPWASDSAGFYEHPNAETVRTQKVQVRKIDDVIQGQKVDVIKIDTEGHEVSVLKGLARTLKQNPQAKLIVELNPECLRRAGKSPEELFETIRSYGKEIYVIDEDNFVLSRITDSLDNWEQYLGPDGYSNIYCVPSAGHQYMMFVSHSPLMEGAEFALVGQINALRTRGILAHVIVPSEGQLVDRLVEDGVSYSIVEGYSFWALSRHGESPESEDYQYRNNLNVVASEKIASTAENIHVTAVVNNTLVNPWGQPAAKSLGLPLVWMIHEFGDADHNIPFPHDIRSIKRFIVEESDLVFCCSDAVRSTMLTGEKELDRKVQTLYNFIDMDAVQQLAGAKPVPKKTPNSLQLCMVGTITEGKGQRLAIQAVAELKKRGINARLWMVGRAAPYYEKLLRREIADLNVKDNIVFVGYRLNPHVYVKNADIVVVCAPHEAFGRTTAEAMLVGTPVVGLDSAGTAEIITDNVTGLLFEPGSVTSLVSKIEKLTKMNTGQIVKKAHDHIIKMLNRDALADKLQTEVTKLKLDKASAAEGKIFSVEWLDAVKIFLQRQDRDHEAYRVLELERDAAEERLRVAQEELSSVLRSKSWKTTMPLRKTVRVLKKLRGKKS